MKLRKRKIIGELDASIANHSQSLLELTAMANVNNTSPSDSYSGSGSGSGGLVRPASIGQHRGSDHSFLHSTHRSVCLDSSRHREYNC